MDIKGPMLKEYAQHYGPVPVPEEVYSDWKTTNCQILCGTRTPTPLKIAVVDCDGADSLPIWERICDKHGYSLDACWIAVTGSGGHHFYFTIPDEIEELPGGMLWGLWDTFGDDGKGKWAKHKEIRLLADNSLVVAPPSVHVTTGDRYRFHKDQNPNAIRIPCPIPRWLMEMPRLGRPRFGEPAAPAPARPAQVARSGNFYSRTEVLDAVENKFFMAREWGLAFASGPNANGWACCYVPGREDPSRSTPSGSFNIRDGTLQDRKDGVTISFFDLGVTLGRYSTWQECRDHLGDRFIGRIQQPKYQHVYRPAR